MLPLRALRDIAAPITIKEDRVTATTPQAVDARLTRSAIFLVATLNPARTPRPPRAACAPTSPA